MSTANIPSRYSSASIAMHWLMVALLIATATALAPPYLAGLAVDKGGSRTTLRTGSS